MWLGGFAFFYGVWLFAKSCDQPAKKPSVSLLFFLLGRLSWYYVSGGANTHYGSG
jgi:hypothetical protein